MAITKRKKLFAEKVNKEEALALKDALKLLKETTTAKFDETIDVALNLNVDPKHADQLVRGTVGLPHGNGKTVRVAVFAKGDAATEAEKAGADVVGAEDLADKIKGGFLDFDRVIAAPDCMPIVGQIGKILGPKGLMPNPKLGTVTPNVGKAVKDVKAGMIEFRVEKQGILHVGVGKKSFTDEKLVDNIMAFYEAVKAAKPSGVKGTYMEKMTVSSTMGPGVPVDFKEL